MSSTDRVTDAYILLRIPSETLTVPELKALASLTPTETGTKGTRVRPETRELPANYIALSTEALSSSKDLNDHIRDLCQRLPTGSFAERFVDADVQIYLTIYWWTTEETNFQLIPASFSALSQIGVPAHFSFMVDQPS
jgi:hypothetical protein